MAEWTHYTRESHGKTRGWVTAFNLEKCERCGAECEAPNSVGISERDAKRLGLERRDALPMEFGYCEEFGGAVCATCDGLGPLKAPETLSEVVAELLDEQALDVRDAYTDRLAAALDAERAAIADRAAELEALGVLRDKWRERAIVRANKLGAIRGALGD